MALAIHQRQNLSERYQDHLSSKFDKHQNRATLYKAPGFRDQFRFFLTNVFYIHVFSSVWIILVFVLTILLKVAKLQYVALAPFCQI